MTKDTPRLNLNKPHGFRPTKHKSAMPENKTTVAVYLKNKQLVLFAFNWQRQTTVTADFTSKQLLLFVFARWSVCQYSMAEENPASQRQTAVTDYL